MSALSLSEIVAFDALGFKTCSVAVCCTKCALDAFLALCLSKNALPVVVFGPAAEDSSSLSESEPESLY